VLKARDILESKYNVSVDVWSATSYKQLHLDALDCERYNMLHPDEEKKVPYITRTLGSEDGVYVSASDYVQMLADSLSKYLPRPLNTLGTFGFGRSEDRASLRDFFEVDAKHIVLATLTGLVKDKKLKPQILSKAIQELGIKPDKLNPLHD
jgi:pyruvate dehydrogenase E1 component